MQDLPMHTQANNKPIIISKSLIMDLMTLWIDFHDSLSTH